MLIRDALDALDDLTQNRAATAAGMSGTRWRDITRGYLVKGNVKVVAPAKTIARMARVVGVTPAQLREVGRDDAALELEKLTVGPAAQRPGYVASRPGGALADVSKDDLLAELARRMRDDEQQRG